MVSIRPSYCFIATVSGGLAIVSVKNPETSIGTKSTIDTLQF
jgi:hypothetical protein